jgi:hypothetical protein
LWGRGLKPGALMRVSLKNKGFFSNTLIDREKN